MANRDPLVEFVLNAPQAKEPLSAEAQHALDEYVKRRIVGDWKARHGPIDNVLKTCWCRYCLDEPSMGLDNPALQRMILCPDCGNKRCPKANHHDNACTGSNEPGQKGSAYE